MPEHTCPPFLAVVLDNPLRRWLHRPASLLRGFVSPGATVADLGCGPGVFTLAMADLVGPTGRVVAIDVEPAMLARVRARAEAAGVLARLDLRRCEVDRLGLDEPLDFVLGFWMVHEVPDPEALLREVRAHLAPSGRFLLAEPLGHVPATAFARSVAMARAAGLHPCGRPAVRLSRAVLFAPGRVG